MECEGQLVISIVIGLITGVLSSFAATYIVFKLQKRKEENENRIRYEKFEGTFYSYPKFGNQAIREVDVIRDGGKFIFNTWKFGEVKTETKISKPAHGVVEMSSNNPNYGRGYYNHIDSDGFGFYDIQLDSDKGEILVHANYSKNKGTVVAGYIWKRHKPGNE